MMFFPAPDESIWVGVLRLELQIPGARSLKDRRRVVSKIRDRLRARHTISVAEVGHLEHHQKAVLAICQVSNNARLLRSMLERLAHDVSSWHVALVVQHNIQILRPYEGILPDSTGWDDGWDEERSDG